MTNKNGEDYFFHHSVSIRIMGEKLDLAKISETLEVEPSHIHRKGELSKLKTPYPTDMWSYDLSMPKSASLDTQLKALWELLKPNKDFLLEMKKVAKIDVYCTYSSNSSTGGFGLSPQALEIFTSLQVFLEVSVIVSASELHQVLSEIL